MLVVKVNENEDPTLTTAGRRASASVRPARFSVPTHRLLQEPLIGLRAAARGVRARLKTGSTCLPCPALAARSCARRGQRHAIARLVTAAQRQRASQKFRHSWGSP